MILLVRKCHYFSQSPLTIPNKAGQDSRSCSQITLLEVKSTLSVLCSNSFSPPFLSFPLPPLTLRLLIFSRLLCICEFVLTVSVLKSVRGTRFPEVMTVRFCQDSCRQRAESIIQCKFSVVCSYGFLL